MAKQRQRVGNPFEQRQEADRFQGISVNPTQINRTEFQPDRGMTAQQMVEGLVGFAGVAGEAYAAKLDKQVEADRIIQTQRATLGLAPTPDATEGGYKAHMAVAIKNQQLKAQAKLNQLAEGEYSDDEWEEIIRDTYAEVDNSLASEYEDYQDYPELQKMTTLSMAEIMPQVTASREAAKLDHAIKRRMQDEEDILLSEIKITDDAASLVKRFEERTSAMKLTQSQKEQILSRVALQGDSQTAIEMTKLFKGERGSTLYERTGQLQNKEDQLKNEKYATQAGELGLEYTKFYEDFLKGNYTEEEAARIIDKRNRETEGRFMSQAQSAAMFAKGREAIAARTRQQQLIQAVQAGDKSIIPGAKKSEVEAALSAGYKQYLSAGVAQIKKNVPEEQQAREIADLQIRAAQIWGDNSAKMGIAIPEWGAKFSSLANANVAATTEGGDVEQLNEQHRATIDQLQQMSPSAQDFYLSSLSDREGDILRNTLALQETGMTGPQALATAQKMERNPNPVSSRDVEKAIESITDSIDDGLFVTDIPDYARGYYMNEVRQKVSAHPMPTSESAKKQIRAYFSDKWTTLSDGIRIKGSPERIRQLTGLHPEAVGQGMQALIESQREQLEPVIASMGIDFDQIIPDVDPESGMVTFVGPAGQVLNTKAIPLSSMRAEYLKYKTKLEKRITDRNLESLNQSTFFGTGGN